MPGHTAYPWLFPNDGTVARIGLTWPVDLTIDAVGDPDDYRLLRAGDDRLPTGERYVRRLLTEAYPDYDIADFPLVRDRGKNGGTESYPISSTRPIESPVAYDVAVVGGTMGATSAFHEGGDHVAIRTGTLAGRLAARDELARYNDAWTAAIGDEVLRNVALAATVGSFGPAQWDRSFAAVNRLLDEHSRLSPGSEGYLAWARTAGRTGLVVGASYRWYRRRLRDGGYVTP